MIFKVFIISIITTLFSKTFAQNLTKPIANDPIIFVPIQTCLFKNEIFVRNGPGCDQNCDNLNRDCTLDSQQTGPGCYCLPGYVRDEAKNCVEGNLYCGNCTQYEYWTANGSPCQTECKTLGQNCTIINKRPPRACYCKAGYARNDSGICIPIEKCPGKI